MEFKLNYARKKKVIFSLLVSSSEGYGHLVRSTSLAKKFKEKGYQNILISPSIEKQKHVNKNIYKERIINNFQQKNSWETIIETYKIKKADYLILDFPILPQQFERTLVNHKIKWLQFSPNLRKKISSNQTICSIPETSLIDYKFKLEKNQKFYLGEENSILRDEFFFKTKVKTEKNNIFICFGGGGDNGTMLWLLKTFFPILKDYNLNLLIGENVNKKKIVELLKKKYSKKKIILVKNKAQQIVNAIDKSYFCINSGGTLSHEISTRGKKMLIITVAKNQIKQAKAWELKGNVYLGDINFKKKILVNFKKKLNEIKKFKKSKLLLKKNPLNKIIHDAIKIIQR